TRATIAAGGKGGMETLYSVSAGLDVHRDTVVVSIRKQAAKGKDLVETRTFATFHDGLVDMVAWLDEHDVPIVGIESTGVYWKPVVRELQLRSPQRIVWLVNPAEVKQVPGRKTDVNDSQWLSKLVMHGLVSPSFLPSQQLEELRKLTRYRTKVVGQQASSSNRIIKELESSGIKLASVCSSVLGKSSLAMIRALLDGDKAPSEIADLACGRLRKKVPELERAVTGTFSDATQFLLRQLLRRHDELQRDLDELDEQIRARMQPYQPAVELLLQVPGLDHTSIAAIIAEIGTDMSVFNSADHATAWGGLCPGSKESAGKSKHAPARKGNKYLRTILVQCAWSATRTRGTFWKQKFGQLVKRLGRKKALFAIARKMLVAIFYILRDGKPYQEPILPPRTEKQIEKQVRRHVAQLAALGFDVTVHPIAATET
ncbi:MAG: IS110 family transposase, partial [Myxococcales bacterium]|nr:IS110 family transposase [Myxococcales bacterium]